MEERALAGCVLCNYRSNDRMEGTNWFDYCYNMDKELFYGNHNTVHSFLGLRVDYIDSSDAKAPNSASMDDTLIWQSCFARMLS